MAREKVSSGWWVERSFEKKKRFWAMTAMSHGIQMMAEMPWPKPHQPWVCWVHHAEK